MSLVKHCCECGSQINKDAKIDICYECLVALAKPGCDFCKETNCVAWGDAYFKSIDKKIGVDFRADMEFNQIDCQFGIVGEDGKFEESCFSDFALDINFCPVCGRKLPSVE